MSQTGLLSLMLLCTPFSLNAMEESPWLFASEIAISSNDNVGQAERNRDIIDAQSILANLDLVRVNELDLQHVMIMRGFVETEQFNTVTDISRITIGGQLIHRWQNTLGFTAPFYLFNAGLQSDTYGAAQRDSAVFKSQLVASKRFTDRITMSTGLDYQQRDATSDVFDTQKVRLFASIDYDLPGRWTYYGTFSLISGDVVSTAQAAFCNGAPASDIFYLVNASKAIESDKAYNAALCGDWFSYRLEADTQTLNIGLNKGLTQDISLDISALAVTVKAAGNNVYDSLLLRAGLLMRF